MCPHRLTKERKATRMKKHSFLKCKNCDKSRISELLTVDKIWIYTFESQRPVTN